MRDLQLVIIHEIVLHLIESRTFGILSNAGVTCRVSSKVNYSVLQGLFAAKPKVRCKTFLRCTKLTRETRGLPYETRLVIIFIPKTDA